jgi:hypothetical protein
LALIFNPRIKLNRGQEASHKHLSSTLQSRKKIEGTETQLHQHPFNQLQDITSTETRKQNSRTAEMSITTETTVESVMAQITSLSFK